MIREVSFEGATVTYLRFIAPGLVATTIMNHGFFETTYASFVRMYYQKTYDAILSTPLSLEDVILGEIVWGATKSLFAAVIMLVICVLWGLFSWNMALMMLPVAFIAGMAFSSLGMLFTSFTKNIEMFNLPIFLFITPMFLFSSVFFPLSSLPDWAQKIAILLPLTFLVSSLRGLALGGFNQYHLGQICWLILISIVCSFLSMVIMRKRIIK